MVKVIAHRGDSVHAPENTIMAFEKAIELGANGIELDVHMCKDGYLVIHHDETVNTPDGKMLIRDMKLEELKQLDMGCGQKIPTLTEVFRLIGNMDFFINIEIKTSTITYDDIEHCLADEINANITPSLVRNCQYYGIELYPWTVDNPIIMNDMINAKVTGIITNDPAKLLDILRSVQPL
jgi:glycerophosphoryl diester phosphodiesterase